MSSGSARSSSEHVIANSLPSNASYFLPSLGLFGSHEFQIIPQLQSCLMELRLTVAYRTSHDLGDFVMLEAFHIMQHKNRSIPRRQPVNRPLQLQPINGSGQLQVLGTEFFPGSFVVRFQSLFERHHRQALLAQLHQDNSDRHAMQPGGERRLPSKGADLAK